MVQGERVVDKIHDAREAKEMAKEAKKVPHLLIFLKLILIDCSKAREARTCTRQNRISPNSDRQHCPLSNFDVNFAKTRSTHAYTSRLLSVEYETPTDRAALDHSSGTKASQNGLGFITRCSGSWKQSDTYLRSSPSGSEVLANLLWPVSVISLLDRFISVRSYPSRFDHLVGETTHIECGCSR